MFGGGEDRDVGTAAFLVLEATGEGFADFVAGSDDDDGDGGAGDGPPVQTGGERGGQ